MRKRVAAWFVEIQELATFAETAARSPSFSSTWCSGPLELPIRTIPFSQNIAALDTAIETKSLAALVGRKEHTGDLLDFPHFVHCQPGWEDRFAVVLWLGRWELAKSQELIWSQVPNIIH